jgi:hypothetical protein
MIESAAFATKCLEHEDAQLRAWAFQVLHACHEVDLSHLPVVERMAAGDPNTAVRTWAIMTLTHIVKDQAPASEKHRLGKQLAAMTLDDSEPDEIRQMAYGSLCVLQCDDFAKWEQGLKGIASLEEIDWKYVHSWQ